MLKIHFGKGSNPNSNEIAMCSRWLFHRYSGNFGSQNIKICQAPNKQALDTAQWLCEFTESSLSPSIMDEPLNFILHLVGGTVKSWCGRGREYGILASVTNTVTFYWAKTIVPCRQGVCAFTPFWRAEPCTNWSWIFQCICKVPVVALCLNADNVQLKQCQQSELWLCLSLFAVWAAWLGL